MPVSKKRDKKQSVKVPRNVGKVSTENPAWLLPTALTLLILGPTWIIISSISRGAYPLPIGNLNTAIGFVFLMSSMVLFTRWK